ncbi:sarcosine oxidase subunit alpha family protein [Amaricoccus solimangrovi]|uniref:Sarcosine oxidase subunit alpha family protein n=1 Tax=Amaricoccus solimangrovi TaxID=2589815 RepID=A0A501X1A7_9RHOB|nr:sarcosine oxidase subunit alpha family protein [Amaricoccus solimangrovi]TPE53526.1 sarcosine oxidase subunit alpha family protein [Amaricoccus solimangrovi]
MSGRLAGGGRLIDRATPVSFTFNGARLSGFAGDTLASALLANGLLLQGRSFKYHRPRGPVASGVEEPNALVNLGTGARSEPNARTTVTELREGLVARSQNHWPSLGFDLGAVNARFAPLLPAGFYYKTFIHPRAAWKSLFEPAIRRSAGLGVVPEEGDADRYEYLYAHCDVLVAGGGVSGLAAALAAGRAGARVLLMEQTPVWGGRALVDGPEIAGGPAADWIAAALGELDALPNVTRRARAMVAGAYDHGYALAEEMLGDTDFGPRARLWRIRARRIVTATGALERPLAFAGNDVPGVMLASAVRDYLELYGVSVGDRTVVVTNNDDGYRTAIALARAGRTVPAVLDARPAAGGALPEEARALGIRIETGRGVARVRGGKAVRGVAVCDQEGEGAVVGRIACDAVAMSGGWSPVVHLWSHSGGRLAWNETLAHFAPDTGRPPLGPDGEGFAIPAGCASGALVAEEAMNDAHAAGLRAAQELGFRVEDTPAPAARSPHEDPPRAVWMMPARARPGLRAKAFLDFQNDVKVSDVRLAAREGYVSVEHAKRYTTLGMATDQGKLSNINGLATLSQALSIPIPEVGTTTFRPPYTPVTFGALAGEARGALFKPTRRTPIDAWSDANGADWEPVGDWRRPFCYRHGTETRAEAVRREVLNTRQGVGVLDASTLGKILVKGADAGKFLDLLYTNVMSSLGIGKCRYGLMCNENGFLFDDGVVIRMAEDTFLCHTTTGGSDRVAAWMEEWLQTEWWDLRVHVVNLTEQYAQIAVVGPKARAVLSALGGMDLSKEAMPFMTFAEGTLGGVPARAHRISFSGELSFEVAVPANRGQAFWDAVMTAGAAHGIAPYGTECLHILRAEKGFIMIGDETDGTVIPQDLGLSWAVSKKKADFIGKRAQARPEMTRPDRETLVGLRTGDPAVVLPDGAHAVDGPVAASGPTRTIGHVTSSYFSPTLGHSIAMALIERGAERMGQVLDFPLEGGEVIRATVCDPVFLDREGSRQNV